MILNSASFSFKNLQLVGKSIGRKNYERCRKYHSSSGHPCEEEESSAPRLEGAGRLRGAAGAALERGLGARDKVRDHVLVSLAEA